MDAGIWRQVKGDFDFVLGELPTALAAEGFGIVTQINLQQTFKDKLGRDTPRYRIIGACNPALAFEAVQLDPHIGLRLPCNIVLYEAEGNTMLGAIDPIATIGDQGPAFAELSQRVREKLARVVASFK